MRRGEIWFVEIPGDSGHEQKGIRPVTLISEVEAGTVIIVPFTSNAQALKYPHTIEVSPSVRNGLKSTSVALVFQMRAIDIKRLKNRIGILDEDPMSEIERLAADLLNL